MRNKTRAVRAELLAGPLATFDTAAKALATARRAFVEEAQPQLNPHADIEPMRAVDARR